MIIKYKKNPETLVKFRDLILAKEDPFLIYRYLIEYLRLPINLNNNPIILGAINATIKRFINKDKSDIIEVLLLCVRVLIKINKIKRAENICLEILKKRHLIENQRIKAEGLLGDIYYKAGKTNKAIKKYKEVICSARMIKSYDLMAVAYHQLGVIFKELGKLDKALEKLNASVRLCKKQGKNYKLGESYYQIGKIYEQKKQWGLALKAYNNALIFKQEVEDEDHYNPGDIYKRIIAIYHKMHEGAKY